MALGFHGCTFNGVPCPTSAHPACLSTLALLSTTAQPAACQAEQNPDAQAHTPFTRTPGLPPCRLAPYSRLASGVSFSTLSHCELRKRKPLLLSDQAKYSQGVSVTKQPALLELLERKVLEGASSRELPGADSQVLVKLIPQTKQNMEMSPNISPSMN